MRESYSTGSVEHVFADFFGEAVRFRPQHFPLRVVPCASLGADGYSRPQWQLERLERFQFENLRHQNSVLRNQSADRQRYVTRKSMIGGRAGTLLVLHTKRKRRVCGREFGQHHGQICGLAVDEREVAFVRNWNEEIPVVCGRQKLADGLFIVKRQAISRPDGMITQYRRFLQTQHFTVLNRDLSRVYHNLHQTRHAMKYLKNAGENRLI